MPHLITCYIRIVFHRSMVDSFDSSLSGTFSIWIKYILPLFLVFQKVHKNVECCHNSRGTTSRRQGGGGGGGLPFLYRFHWISKAEDRISSQKIFKVLCNNFDLCGYKFSKTDFPYKNVLWNISMFSLH